MRIKRNIKLPFTVLEKKGKGVTLTAILHTGTNFKSFSINGKVKGPKGLTDSSFLYKSILCIGYVFQHLFPNLLEQGRRSAILTYSLPTNTDRSRFLQYCFHYTIKDGSDIEAVFNKAFSSVDFLNEKISACMIQAHSESSDP